jgi:sporulation protein YlmC with PRC-barrel domain
MKSKYLAAALLGTALLTGAAFAETATPDRSNINTAVHKEGQWRSSKLIGVNVYNDNNDKIGDIQELIVDKSGKVENVVLGVGGFLGMGEHYVAVPMDKLKWVNEPVRTSSTAAPADKSADKDKSTVGTNNRPARASDEKWYPDHAVFNATKDQLKAMPQFKYN